MKIKVEKNSSGFKYIEFSHSSHNHKSLRIWLNSSINTTLIDNVEYAQFPLRNAIVTTTRKGTLVVRPSTNSNVYLISIDSGYRGFADLTPISGEVVAKWDVYHSPNGSLGETAYALINGSNSIEVKWSRSGRRVDKTDGTTIYRIDGTQSEKFDENLTELLT